MTDELRAAIMALPTWDKRTVPGGLHVKRSDVLDLLAATPEPAPDVEAAWTALVQGFVYLDHKNIIVRHRPLIEAALRAALHPADPSRREP